MCKLYSGVGDGRENRASDNQARSQIIKDTFGDVKESLANQFDPAKA